MKRLIKTSLAVFGLVRLLSASPSFAEEKSRAEQLGLDKICSLGTKGATTFEDRGVSPCDKDGKTSYYFCPKSTLAGIGYTAPPYGRMYAFERDGETYYVECRGKKLSRAMEFYENRNPKWEEYYDEGMLDSRHEWNENENKKLEEDYTRGKLLSRIVWDENGLEKGYDKEGRLTHICARYENGNIKRALIYTRGKLSRIIDWYKDRPKHFKPSEKMSHPESCNYTVSYSEEFCENIAEEVQFVDGKLEGIAYNNGPKAWRANFVRGKLEGKAMRWYSHGGIELEENYVDGVLEGTITSYHRNGKIKQVEDYVKGELKAKYCFDAKGQRISCKAVKR